MNTRLFTLCLAATMLLGCVASVSAAKKEKKPKEKKEYVWDWDGTRSGDPTMDEYLVKVDELWKNLGQYSANYETFTYKVDTFFVGDKPYLMAYMQDADGKMASIHRVNWQIANSILDGTNIVLDATNVSLMTANATLALTNLGLAAISFAPYIKGGPMVIGKGMKELSEINKVNTANKKMWKAMKNGAIDPATLGVFSDAAVKQMKQCCRIKEVVETAPEYTAIVEVQRQKTEGDMQNELASINDKWETSEILPEDASKTLDEDSWEGLDD